MSGAMVKVGGQVPVAAPVEESPENLLTVIARAVANPALDVEKMERLLAMHGQIVAQQRQTAFMEAMARLTPKLPYLNQKGRIQISGQPLRKYARLEDVDRAIRPLIAEEGFSLSFDTQPLEGGKIRVSCRLSHREGHYETKQIDLPIDKSGSKNDAQAVISTVSYGRRALTKMFFNLVETGEDDDGQGGSNPITKDQVAELRTVFTKTVTRDGKVYNFNQKKFLEHMGVGKVEDILARDWQKARNATETWRRNAQTA